MAEKEQLPKLVELDRLAREAAAKYPTPRFLYQNVQRSQGKHFVGIVGPRGVGKTIMLKQLAKETKHSFYVSLDTVNDLDLFALARQLAFDVKVTHLFLDEVHFVPEFGQKLKQIYDFLDVHVVFTSSTSLELYASSYDLSRRVVLQTLFPFSFREYIYFRHGDTLTSFGVDDLLGGNIPPDHLQYVNDFEDFLRGGIMPFALEEPSPLMILENVLDTIVHRDIPAVADITLKETQALRRMVTFIGRSPVEGINYSTLSQNLGITKYKAQQYTELLENAFVLNRVFPKGTNVRREPKILLTVPYRLLFQDYDQAVGALREDFFVHMMRAQGRDVYYLKSTRGAKTPDYLLNTADREVVIEIGGKGKGRQQFKGVEAEKQIILSHSLACTGIKRPLFLAGCLN